jgi:hypothetical protein
MLQCDRCLEREFERCEYKEGKRKCERCIKDKQGCYWAGVTKEGGRRAEKKAKVTKKKAEKGEAEEALGE